MYIYGLNIHSVPIFVDFIQFGLYCRLMFNYIFIFVKLWSIWSFSLTVFKRYMSRVSSWFF